MTEVQEDYFSRYRNACLRYNMYPLRRIMKQSVGSELCVPVEAVRPEHWHCLISSMYKDNSLTKIHFASCVSPPVGENDTQLTRNKRDKGIASPYGRSQQNVRNISTGIGELLRFSKALIILKLENLVISCFEAKKLAVGLAESCSLKLLSLSGCKFEPYAFKVICAGLCRSRVSWIDLSSCIFNPGDIECIGEVVKTHCTRRSNEMFPQTLRHNVANLDALPGINRISLNYNALALGTISTLLTFMQDELFLKALDFQNCGINNEGAEALLRFAAHNQKLEVIDLRLNDIDEDLLQRIEQQLILNKGGKNHTCTYSPLWKPSEMITTYNNIGKGKISKRTSVYKCKIYKRVSKSLSAKSSSVSSQKVTMVDKAISTDTSEPCRTVKMVDKAASVQMVAEDEIPKAVLELVNAWRLTLHNEKKIRHFYEAKCRRLEKENGLMKEYVHHQGDDIYIDQETYLDIKHTFEKLKIFFDVMKKYGLWEYISMLGFDESTDVIIKEDDSQKCVKVLKKDAVVCAEENQEKIVAEPCCNCQKIDSKHCQTESPAVLTEDSQICNHEANIKKSENKGKAVQTKDPLNEKVAYKLLREIMSDYNNSLLNQEQGGKSKKDKMTNTISLPQDNAKPSSSKLSSTLPSKAASAAHMLIKQMTSGSLPKNIEEIISPVELYITVKKELERRGKKPVPSSVAEKPGVSYQELKTSVVTDHDCIRPEPSSPKTNDRVSKLSEETTNEEDFDNITISELIAREKAAKQKRASQKYIPTKKECKKPSPLHKNISHAKIKETKSISKPEQVMPKSKLKHTNSSQSSSKKFPVRSNQSSDEINSSDSVVTASDKLSTASSSSSSSSSKLYVKTPSSHSESNSQKSFFGESVSDASTFKDVESISEIEVSQFLCDIKEFEKQFESQKKMASLMKSTNSQSSTLQDSASKSGNSRLAEVVKSEASSVKNASNKSDKSFKSDVCQHLKTKNTNKHNKNRPKSNSSKSSSVPSLSDITTVSSKTLNTDSVMKQITGSEGDSDKRN